MIYILSGASQNHSKSLSKFIQSVYQNVTIPFELYIYDLGCTKEYIESIQNMYPNANLRTFDYSKYPSYFNIQINAGEYAWKPAIINEVLEEIKEKGLKEEENIMVWCDAGNLILPSFEKLIETTRKCKIYSPCSGANIKKWTHIKTQQYFKIAKRQRVLGFRNRSAGFVGYNITYPEVQDFIKQFVEHAKIKKCIAPEGSNRKNHRQDQALFSILYFFFKEKYKTSVVNEMIGMSIHNDCD